MAGSYSPNPLFTILDSDGDPVDGALFYTYAAGTTTPQTTYQDVALTTPNSNPVVALSGGRLPPIILPAGQSFKYVVNTPGGVLLWTRDNVTNQSVGELDIPGTFGEDVTANDAVYLSNGDGGRTAGQWFKADADNPYSSITPSVGFAVATTTSAQSGLIRVEGRMTGFAGLVTGATYYVSSTAGAITSTAPAFGRRVGQADGTTSLVITGSEPAATTTSTDLQGVAGEALVFGEAVYLSKGDGALTAGRWYKTDADTAYASMTAYVGMVLSTSVSTAGAVSIRLLGEVTGLSGLVAGSDYYLSATAGAITVTAPTNARWFGRATSTTVLELAGPAQVPLTGAPSTITTTGTQTALALPAGTGPLTIIANNASLLTLQGITAGMDGQALTIISKGAGQVDLANQNGSANAANRIICDVTATISLAAGYGRAVLLYDASESRWRVVFHEQGAPITPTYAGGNFTANAGTWTVESGDVVTNQYWLRGRQLHLTYFLSTTSTSGGMGTDLIAAIPGGFVSSTDTGTPFRVIDAGTAATGFAVVASGGSSVIFRKVDTSAWTSSATNTTSIIGQIVVPVQ